MEQPQSAQEQAAPFKNGVTGVIAPPGGQRRLQLVLSSDLMSCRLVVWKFLLLKEQQLLEVMIMLRPNNIHLARYIEINKTIIGLSGQINCFSLPGVHRLSSTVSKHSSSRRVDGLIFQQVSLQGIQWVVLILSHRDGQRFIH